MGWLHVSLTNRNPKPQDGRLSATKKPLCFSLPGISKILYHNSLVLVTERLEEVTESCIELFAFPPEQPLLIHQITFQVSLDVTENKCCTQMKGKKQRKTSTVIAFLGMTNTKAASSVQSSHQHWSLGSLCFLLSPQTRWKLLIPLGGELEKTVC